MSAPSVSGRVWKGEAQVESTASRAPALCAISAAPATLSSRRTSIAGVGLLACFALWALSEDSLWAVAATMGAEQAGLGETGMGLVLSLSTLGGLVASALVGLAGMTFVLLVPLVLISRHSVRAEAAARPAPQAGFPQVAIV